MKQLTGNQVRQMFLDYFKSKGHMIEPGASLIPHNDPTLLWINAGVAALKKYFDGSEKPACNRIANAQKSIRTNDIENVGKTARHHTFFEMLGNFSIGDYFKEEAIPFAWEFLTSPEWIGFDKEKLYVTVYTDDEDAYRIWTEVCHVDPSHILKTYENFWEIGEGPGGPDSEIFYDRGEKYDPEGLGEKLFFEEMENDRYIEVWNVVFSQYDCNPAIDRKEYKELPQKNIDTGMGLERLAVVMQDVDSVFDIDTMKAIRDKICEMSGKKYEVDAMDDVSIRLITDHIRSSTFLVSDGVMPSNEGRGYVLRRLIRRAARHGKMLGIDGLFLAKLSETVINESKDGYPELEEKKEFIFKVLTQEEEKFNKTIDQGLAILSDLMEEMKKNGKKELSGADTFKLYDTYGFPVDLTEEILEEKGFSYNEDEFKACMEEQRQKARSARKVTNYMGADATVYEQIDPSITTEFVGYENLTYASKVTVMTTETEIVEALSDGDAGTIIVEKTPFYATMGGQQGDKGQIRTADGVFQVEDTVKLLGGKYGHIGHMVSGMIHTGEKVELLVDADLRAKTCANHSATHLLQKALREVLGTHVEQAGSYQDSERTRFDFTHFAAMTPEELQKVEEMVNEKINEGMEVRTDIMTVDEAKKTGAMALFGEKYGEKVRVVSMGEFSREFCGGTHVKNTAEIKTFKILSESGVAAGVRRIEALTGDNVIAYYKKMEEEFQEAAKVVKSTPANLKERLEHLTAEMKDLQSENEALKSRAAKDALGDVMNQIEDVKGVKLLATSVSGVDMNGLRDLGDQLKDKIGEGVVVIASDCDGKVNLIAMATDAAMKQGAHAGNLIKAIAGNVGGGGGGRPNMAQAGGKNPAGIPDAIAQAKTALENMLK